MKNMIDIVFIPWHRIWTWNRPYLSTKVSHKTQKNNKWKFGTRDNMLPLWVAFKNNNINCIYTKDGVTGQQMWSRPSPQAGDLVDWQVTTRGPRSGIQGLPHESCRIIMIGLRYAWFYCMFFRHKLIYVYLTYSVITGPLEYKREEPPQLVTRKSSSPKDLNPRRFCCFFPYTNCFYLYILYKTDDVDTRSFDIYASSLWTLYL